MFDGSTFHRSVRQQTFKSNKLLIDRFKMQTWSICQTTKQIHINKRIVQHPTMRSNRSFDWLIAWLIDLLFDWLIHWLTDYLIDWLFVWWLMNVLGKISSFSLILSFCLAFQLTNQFNDEWKCSSSGNHIENLYHSMFVTFCAVDDVS